MVKILIVDDVEGIRQSLQIVLECAGFDILEAENGRDALDALKKTDDVDIVLTDIMMPKMNGLQLCKEIRNTFKHIKIIAMSGGGSLLQDAPTLEDAAKFADKVIRKPFRKGDILTLLDEMIA